MSDPAILLGYEIGSGRAVRIPLRHTVWCGLTQQAGKTTGMAGAIGRSGLRAITFITKRGERNFEDSPRVPAYFRPACDWQSVTALLDAWLQSATGKPGERLPLSLRPYLIQACSGAVGAPTAATPPKTLNEVFCNVAQLEADAEGKVDARNCLLLRSYLEEALAMLEKGGARDSAIKLASQINCMDLSAYPVALQALCIASTIEHIAEHETGVIILIPEAWEFIPREGQTACKQAIERMARKGACLGNYLWIDSQDLAGISIVVRKMCSVYLLGVQREANEVARTLKHLPDGMSRPTAGGIMELKVGEFWCAYDQALHCCYVQPEWLDADPERARTYATGVEQTVKGRRVMVELPASYVARPAASTGPAKPVRKTSKAKAQPPEMIDAAPLGGVQ